MKKKMKMIFTKDEIQRITFESAKFIIVDIHQMTQSSAKHFLSNISKVWMDKFSMMVIHGYRHGTKLRDSIRMEGYFERNYNMKTYKNNPGVTLIQFSESIY